MRRSCSAGCLDISYYTASLGQGAPGVRCAVGITGMQDGRARQRRPRGGERARRKASKLIEHVGARRRGYRG